MEFLGRCTTIHVNSMQQALYIRIYIYYTQYISQSNGIFSFNFESIDRIGSPRKNSGCTLLVHIKLETIRNIEKLSKGN